MPVLFISRFSPGMLPTGKHISHLNHSKLFIVANKETMIASRITLRAQHRKRQKMYYRVAIRRKEGQLDRPPSWQWKSTILSSLQTLFQFLRLYGALPQDHLRVFSSSSQESLEKQLAQENNGLGSHNNSRYTVLKRGGFYA